MRGASFHDSMGCSLGKEPEADPSPRKPADRTRSSLRRQHTPTTSIMGGAVHDVTGAPAPAPAVAFNLPPEEDPTFGDSHREHDPEGASHSAIRLDVASLASRNSRSKSLTPRGDDTGGDTSHRSQESDRPVMDGHEDGVSWLYEQGKKAFQENEFTIALTNFRRQRAT